MTATLTLLPTAKVGGKPPFTIPGWVTIPTERVATSTCAGTALEHERRPDGRQAYRTLHPLPSETSLQALRWETYRLQVSLLAIEYKLNARRMLLNLLLQRMIQLLEATGSR